MHPLAFVLRAALGGAVGLGIGLVVAFAGHDAEANGIGAGLTLAFLLGTLGCLTGAVVAAFHSRREVRDEALDDYREPDRP